MYSTEFKPNLMPSNNNKLKVVLGLTLSGFLISALAGIVMYGSKKKECVTTESNGMENNRENVVEMTANSTIIVPNPTKPRVFSVEEMTAATQKFKGIIGKGGFGSVFFGKLPEGNDIAVKVLSLFNDQGVQQFLNEVILTLLNHVICFLFNRISISGSNPIMSLTTWMDNGLVKLI
jgi:hypothetical protein